MKKLTTTTKNEVVIQNDHFSIDGGKPKKRCLWAGADKCPASCGDTSQCTEEKNHLVKVGEGVIALCFVK